MRHLFLAALLLVIPTGIAGAQDHDHDSTVHRSFDNPGDWAEAWDSPDRFKWQKPGVVIQLLGIGEGQRIADLGAGTGYFTSYLSAMVGAGGKVYAVDVEPAMLEHIRSREELATAANLVTVLAEPDDPKLPEGELDLVLTVNTWHHIDKRIRYLKRLARALRPRGRLAIIDWREGELPMGPPAGHKLSRDAVVRELEKGGWTFISESVALPYQYFLVFQVPEK